MKKELDYRDDELIDLGAVTDETHGGLPGNDPDFAQPKSVIGILVD